MRNLYVYVGEVGVVFEITITDEAGVALDLMGSTVYMDLEGIGSLECDPFDLGAGRVDYEVLGTEFTVPRITTGQFRAVWTVPSPATVKTQRFEFEVRRAVLAT